MNARTRARTRTRTTRLTTSALLALGLVAALLALSAQPAAAGPAATTTAGGVGILPPRARPTGPDAAPFGFAGPKPLDPSTGIVRPTPAPTLDTTPFGFAKPATTLRYRPNVVRPTPAPVCRDGTCGVLCDGSFGAEQVDDVEIRRVRRKPTRGLERGRTRVIRVSTKVIRPACAPCDPCGTVCYDPCDPCRVVTYRDKMSVPAVHWSSGYHDGCDDLCGDVSACATTCAPCATPCRVVPVRRCVTPCAPTCAPCFPRYPCGPRWGCGPCVRPAVRIGFGWPCGGWGWGWGGWGGCGPCW